MERVGLERWRERARERLEMERGEMGGIEMGDAEMGVQGRLRERERWTEGERLSELGEMGR